MRSKMRSRLRKVANDYHKLFDIELKMLWLNGRVKSLNVFDYESDFWMTYGLNNGDRI